MRKTRIDSRQGSEMQRPGHSSYSDMFEIAQQKAAFDLVCYINADIIFLSDFIAAAARAKREFKKFLMIGRRRDWDLGAERIIDFDDENWEVKLRNEIGEKGKLHPPTGIDYFLFTKGLYEKMPPFAIGRPVWDHFFVYHAGVKGAAVLDATNQVMILHQNHDYSHHSGGFKGVWAGVEAKKNLALAASGKHKHHIEHATHKMTHDKISPRTLQRAYRIIVKDSQIRLARFFVWAKATVLKLIQGK